MHRSIFQPLYAISPQKLPYQLSCAQPQLSLSQHVFRYVQVDVRQVATYPVYPDAGQSLYIGGKAAFAATAIEKPVILTLPPGRYFGIWFYPGAGAQLLPSLQAAFGIAGICSVDIDLALCEAEDLADFAKKADSMLGGAQRCMARLHKFDSLLTQCSFHSVANFAKHIGVSERHANRLSKQFFAVSLKKLMSLRQLQHIAQHALTSGAASEQALQYGFFDQAHMINKFRHFYQCTPKQFSVRLMSEISNL